MILTEFHRIVSSCYCRIWFHVDRLGDWSEWEKFRHDHRWIRQLSHGTIQRHFELFKEHWCPNSARSSKTTFSNCWMYLFSFKFTFQVILGAVLIEGRLWERRSRVPWSMSGHSKRRTATTPCTGTKRHYRRGRLCHWGNAQLIKNIDFFLNKNCWFVFSGENYVWCQQTWR